MGERGRVSTCVVDADLTAYFLAQILAAYFLAQI
jgi:hypothetical protein